MWLNGFKTFKTTALIFLKLFFSNFPVYMLLTKLDFDLINMDVVYMHPFIFVTDKSIWASVYILQGTLGLVFPVVVFFFFFSKKCCALKMVKWWEKSRF